MKQSLTYPSCKSEIELTDVLRNQIEEQVRRELAETARAQTAALNERRRQFDIEKQKLLEAQSEFDARIVREVNLHKAKILEQARGEVVLQMSAEMKDNESRLQEVMHQLQIAQTAELALRKRERELDAKHQELELHVARQIDSERSKIRIEVSEQIYEQHQLKDAEKDKKISDLAAKIKDLRCKVEQGSQQLQGEVQELALEQTA